MEKKNRRQSNSKYNFIQYVFFEKGICGVQWGSPEMLQEFENFCVKSNLTVCKVRLLLTASYRKILGEQDVLLVPTIILLLPHFPCL